MKTCWTKKEKWAAFRREDILNDYYDPNCKDPVCFEFEKYRGRKGDLINYIDRYSSNLEIYDWREVSEPFSATLEFQDYGRGRSSVTFQWVDINKGCKYEMFCKDLTDILQNFTIFGNTMSLIIRADSKPEPLTINGEWYICKRGCNYGIRLKLD